jgi:hypothetical protein
VLSIVPPLMVMVGRLDPLGASRSNVLAAAAFAKLSVPAVS